MPLEQFGTTERMRHIPPVEDLIRRLDLEVRKTIRAIFERGSVEKPEISPEVESHLKRLCRSIERVAEIARHGKPMPSSPNTDTRGKLESATANAVGALSVLDRVHFTQRTPFNSFERSRAEMLHSAVLIVIKQTRELVDEVARSYPAIRELIASVAPIEIRMIELKAAEPAEAVEVAGTL